MWKRHYNRWQQKRVDNVLFIFNIVTAVLAFLLLCATLLWPPIVLGVGLLMAVNGVMRLVTAARGWDAFCSLRVGDEKDSYANRHWFAILSGLFFIVIGLGFDVYFVLQFMGVI